MNKIFTWLSVLTKNQFKKPMFIFILVIAAILSVLCGLEASNDSGANNENAYSVGIVALDNNPLSKELTDALLNYKGIVKFIKYENEEPGIKDLLSSELIAVMVMPEHFDMRMQSGDYFRCVKVIKQPSNIIQLAVNEIFYAELIKLAGKDLILNYADETGLFTDDISDELESYYDKYVTGDDTFHLNFIEYGEYASEGSGSVEGSDETRGGDLNGRSDADLIGDERESATGISNSAASVLTGMVAILIYLAGLMGGIVFLRERENNSFVIYKKSTAFIARILYALIPALIISIVAALGITLGIAKANGFNFALLGKQFAIGLFASVLTAATSILLTYICRKSSIMIATLPMILLICLFACPIFINTAAYIPAARYIRMVFAPYYYIHPF